MEKKKVVFTFVEAGLGHIVPIASISQAFEKKYGNEFDIVRSYIFSNSNRESVKKMGQECIVHTKKLTNSRVFRFLESVSYCFSSKTTHRFLDLHFKKNIKDFLLDLQELQPSLMVSAYYLPSHLAVKSNQQGLTNTLIATYSPDPYIYPAWDKTCDLFLVNNHSAYEMAIKKGFKKETVKELPLLVRDEFNHSVNISDKNLAKERLGLNEKFTLLLTTGAYGSKKNIKLFKKIIELDLDINFVVVCGKNQLQKDEMDKISQKAKGKTNISIVGFTDKMNEYMLASDLIIGKGGGNTIFEAIYCCCPLIVFFEISKLEKEIAKYWAKQGIVIRERKIKNIIDIIKDKVVNQNSIDNNIEKYEKYKQLDGAEKYADTLYELLKNSDNRKVKNGNI